VREEGPTRNKIWGILKYLPVEFFIENQRPVGLKDTCQCSLGSKIGVWQQVF